MHQGSVTGVEAERLQYLSGEMDAFDFRCRKLWIVSKSEGFGIE